MPDRAEQRVGREAAAGEREESQSGPCADPQESGGPYCSECGWLLERHTAPAPRQLSDVLERILAEIPAEEAQLRGRLEATRQSALYAPPELQQAWWWRASAVLGTRATELTPEGSPEPFPEWVERTRRIFAGECIE